MAFALCSLSVIVLNKMRDDGIKMWERITETLFVSKQKRSTNREVYRSFSANGSFVKIMMKKNAGNDRVK